jgi:hypothetical protein
MMKIEAESLSELLKLGVRLFDRSLLLSAEEAGGPPCNVFGVGSQCRAMGVSRPMAFSASLCAAAHNGSIEFIEPCDHANMAVLAGWIPSKRASIQN